MKRHGTHVALFALTFLTTTWAGSAGQPSFFWGLWYSLPILAILGAHEFGHYFACQYHGVAATLPYFIPAPPFTLTGTFGAVIRIKQAFPSKRALFDIGVAGPIAGFVVLLPFLYLGLHLSTIGPISSDPDVQIFLGEPLLLKALAWLQFGVLPKGQDIMLHPMGFAAWIGMLVTALNLMPFGQLDGGHIAYSLLGRRAVFVSIATLAIAAGLAVKSMSWVAPTVMMLIMALVLGVRHPTIIDEDTPLDARRRWIAAFCLVIFIISFTPVPIVLMVR